MWRALAVNKEPQTSSSGRALYQCECVKRVAQRLRTRSRYLMRGLLRGARVPLIEARTAGRGCTALQRLPRLALRWRYDGRRAQKAQPIELIEMMSERGV